MFRRLALLILLGGLGWQLNREQQAGRFRESDHLFLDFLLANNRDRFETKGGPAVSSDQVVFLRIREEDRVDYVEWPPQPLDWQMMLGSLAPYEPDVVVLATPLAWGGFSKPEFLPALAQALISLPNAVQSAEVRLLPAGDAAPQGLPSPEEVLGQPPPAPAHVAGDVTLARQIGTWLVPPDPALRGTVEGGFTVLPYTEPGKAVVEVPLILRTGTTLVPSLALQALTRHRRTPYAGQWLRLGAGAGLHLGEGWFLPLTDSGSFVVNSQLSVPSINALDLMTGGLADALSAQDKAILGKGKIVVVGIDNDRGAPSSARLQAQLVAQALALPSASSLDLRLQWAVWGVVGALTVLILPSVRSRGRAIWAGLGLIFAGLVTSYLVFQSNLLWCPASAPALLVVGGMLFVFVFGPARRKGSKAPAPSLAPEAVDGNASDAQA